MNTMNANTSPCACTDCRGATCTCGCQAAPAVAQAGCQCGCQQGKACGCR